MTRVRSVLRNAVIKRANGCCEYCLLSQDDVSFSFHIEHIRATKHYGETELHNLCLSCPTCNRYKGSDISSVDPETDKINELFNPRTHVWSVHFQLNGARITPLSAIGRVTASLLRFNHPERMAEREILILLSHYPCKSV
jgi:hypothetical protein